VWQENGEGVSRSPIAHRHPRGGLSRIFDRFARASNVDDRKFHGRASACTSAG
jgi:hypothetical protein